MVFPKKNILSSVSKVKTKCWKDKNILYCIAQGRNNIQYNIKIKMLSRPWERQNIFNIYKLNYSYYLTCSGSMWWDNIFQQHQSIAYFKKLF